MIYPVPKVFNPCYIPPIDVILSTSSYCSKKLYGIHIIVWNILILEVADLISNLSLGQIILLKRPTLTL